MFASAKVPHMRNATALISVEQIENSIVFIRDERVMLDSDLADLYEVSTKALVVRLRSRWIRMFVISKLLSSADPW
jgi:hypothetical protein